MTKKEYEKKLKLNPNDAQLYRAYALYLVEEDYDYHKLAKDENME